MLGGGLELGHMYTISGVTGGGKTSVINEIVYHWLFNSPHKVGIVSMELSAAQYGETVLSRHLQQKLARLSASEKTVLLANESTQKSAAELFEVDGASRFMLIDDRDSTLDQLQSVIEEMIISSNVKVVVIDPWSDCLDGLSNEEQALANKWIKSVIKSHGVSFFLVNHVRKSASGRPDQSSGGKITESDIMGSSTTMKSASANILLMRNKEATDVVERNTTTISLAKNRFLGLTGPAGEIYYDFATHTLHKLADWQAVNGTGEF
jgi:replicative DNA helicase